MNKTKEIPEGLDLREILSDKWYREHLTEPDPKKAKASKTRQED